MSEYRFVVPGRPVPYLRMTQTERGMAIRGKGRKAERINAYWDYKSAVGWSAKAAGVRPIEGDVEVEVICYVCGQAGDASNYAKAVEDALNGIAYADDRQVSDVIARKRRAKRAEERAEVIVRRAVS